MLYIGSEPAKLFPKLFQSVTHLSAFCVSICEIFYCTTVLEIACASLRRSESRCACFTLCLVLVTK